MNNSGVTVSDTFFKRYRELVRTEMLPYQWKVLNDEADITIERERDDASIPNEKSHAMENFRIAAGLSSGEHYGWVFQDSDVYKWLEAAAYSLKDHPDEALKKAADQVVELIGAAQEPDGYIGTYFTIMEPARRFKRLGESHELYCAGHLMEACVAYHAISPESKALSIARKLADCIDQSFGPEEGKIHGADGHEEIEIGLMRLYHTTGEERYLRLAEYFLEIRGQDPQFFARQYREDGGKPLIGGLESFSAAYLQAHRPVRQQDTAEGHAVRVVYLCTALADLAATKKDEGLRKTCETLWRNITERRMYITGGIGSTVRGEAFTADYDLPTDTMYCETCASIGLIFFARQMLRSGARGEYADIMERALYNTALSGMALDGKHFFYVNPLEAVPEKSRKDPGKSHVKCVRPEWLGCACCPPNLARLLSSVGDYIYTVSEQTILVNLFIQSELTCKTEQGGEVSVSLQTDYPKTGRILCTVSNQGKIPVRFGLRIPSWHDGIQGIVDGSAQEILNEDGFWYISLTPGEHRIEYTLELLPKRWYANAKVSDCVRRVSIARGPQIYCLEEADNGKDLHCLSVIQNAPLKYERREELLGGIGMIRTPGLRLLNRDEEAALYTDDPGALLTKTQELCFIPYYAWANRGENEMRVWVQEAPPS
ncbi:MAG: glycoside hydrolase family 127 protein [Lachnospiraceae bacterium]|nr:glycoside hydrolase family 127 protein [Lachnospiraceae bacterium]